MAADIRQQQLLAMADQDLAEWRDVAFRTMCDQAPAFYLDRLPAAWECDSRELVPATMIEPLVHIGLLQMAKWTAEGDRDRVG